MKKIEIGESEIIRCLSNYENLLKDVRDRIQYLYTSVATTNDVLESLQIRSGSGGVTGKHGKRDLADVWQTYQENEKQYAAFLNSYIAGLVEEEEELKRIWICYQCLPHKQRMVLKTLYVEHKPWKMAKSDLHMSHTTFSNYRAAAIKNIQKFFASTLTDLQLLKQSRLELPKKEDIRKIKKKTETYQMSFEDYQDRWKGS